MAPDDHRRHSTAQRPTPLLHDGLASWHPLLRTARREPETESARSTVPRISHGERQPRQDKQDSRNSIDRRVNREPRPRSNDDRKRVLLTNHKCRDEQLIKSEGKRDE